MDVNSLIRDENERKTAIGLEFLNMVAAGKIIPAEMIVRMLRKIIYSGNGRTRFILSSFPDIIEQAKEFEKSCAQIAAILYLTGEEGRVEIKNNNLSLFNIDSLFLKEFRLKPVQNWNFYLDKPLTRKIVKTVLVVGPYLSGKTTVSKILASKLGYKHIDWLAFQDKVKKSKGTDEEPFEGEVNPDEVVAAVHKYFEGLKGDELNQTYVYDSHILLGVDDDKAFNDIQEQHPPSHMIFCQAETDVLVARHKKKNEIEELSEEQTEELLAKMEKIKQAHFRMLDWSPNWTVSGLTEVHRINTEVSEETLTGELLEIFKRKVILVNHEKRLTVDTTCANLAIKYNFLYISVYQTIKQHIESNTEMGKRLLATKKQKDIKLQTQAKDEFNEIDYSAVHFDLDLVIQLILNTINAFKGNQKYILLEGFCNSGKLILDDDKLELRFMDELFQVERHIGEVQAVIGLQFNSEKEYIEEYEIQYEEFPEPEVVEVKRPEGEEGEEAEQQPPAEEEEKKAPAFKVEDWKWTVTDRKSKNLPQLFMTSKGIAARHDLRTAEQYSSSQYEAISKSLDEFCAKVIEANDSTEKYIYQQVIFNE